MTKLADRFEMYRLGAPLFYGPTAEHLVSLYGKYKKNELVCMIRAYFDESETRSNRGHFILGCVVSTAQKFNRFDHQWNKMLKKKGLPYLHATELGLTSGIPSGVCKGLSDSDVIFLRDKLEALK